MSYTTEQLLTAIDHARTQLRDLDYDYPPSDLHEPLRTTIARLTRILRAYGRVSEWEHQDYDEYSKAKVKKS
jgi:hypothetical protein